MYEKFRRLTWYLKGSFGNYGAELSKLARKKSLQETLAVTLRERGQFPFRVKFSRAASIRRIEAYSQSFTSLTETALLKRELQTSNYISIS